MEKRKYQKQIACFSKYEDLELQYIKSFNIKKYSINEFKEYKLIFSVYIEEISILIHELSKKDAKSVPLIINKYKKYIELKSFLKNFIYNKKDKKIDDIFKLIPELILINKVNFIKNKNNSINLVISNKEAKEIFNTNIPNKNDIIEEDLSSPKLFRLNPFFKNSEIISDSCQTYFSLNKNFVVFNSFHDNEVFLIYQNYDNDNIDIMKLANKQIVKSIKNIETKLSLIEHFFDKKNEFDYLLTADRNKDIKIYNISLDYQLLNSLYNGNSFGFISSCLLLVNDNLLITSIFGKKKEDYTKVYSIKNIFNKEKKNLLDKPKEKNVTLLSKISGTNNIVICSLLFWDNKRDKNKYLIQLSYNKVLINDIDNYKLYDCLETKENNKNHILYSGSVFKDNLLIAISNEGSIFSWNLIFKNLVTKININNSLLSDCILWSNNYLIISANNANKNSIIKILDISKFKIINTIFVKDITGISCIRKIIHPEKGDSLLATGDNNKIVLLSI